MKNVLTTVVLLTVCAVAMAAPPSANDDRDSSAEMRVVHNTAYINANNILMFVTNVGSFGRDLGGLFGEDAGTFYPFVTIEDLENDLIETYVMYAAGPWIGGKVLGETRVAIAEYSSEYVPGPMNQIVSIVGDDTVWTYDPNCLADPDYRVYKLHSDSLADDPNDDYLNWPVDQGAPVTGPDLPDMRGEQMTWAVFNDADPDQHQENQGETEPLGIEIQTRTWAEDSYGEDMAVLGGFVEAVNSNTTGLGRVEVAVVDPSALTGHDYAVVFEDDPFYEVVWNVVDLTTGTTLLAYQVDQTGADEAPVVDGMKIRVIGPDVGVIEIDETTNGDGPLDPPEDVMYSLNSTDDWYISSDQGSDFSRMNWRGLMNNEDYELRFTSAGSEYYDWTTDELMPGRAPFEAWNIGPDTPDDPSDDAQINIFFIDDDANGAWSFGDRIYLSEHPYEEPSPSMADYVWPDDFHIGRIVFNDYSGSLDVPDVGTVVRFECAEDSLNRPVDTFHFSSPELQTFETGGKGNLIHMAYKLYNKGGHQINDCYFSLWVDPDLGGHIDDLVGCDSTTDRAFCYNGSDFDLQFGAIVPSIGFEIVHGPLVPSVADTAVFEDNQVPGYRNLGLTAFSKYVNGTDPNSPFEVYDYMQGLIPGGYPYMFNGQITKYMHSGDPVAGTGDLDSEPADRRILLSSGPFDFAPGDSQYVEIKIAVGQGVDRLSSIDKLGEVLAACCRVRGDVTHDIPPSVDISDVVYLANFIFLNGPGLVCDEDGDINGDGNQLPDISDLVYLVHYMFLEGPPPEECP